MDEHRATLEVSNGAPEARASWRSAPPAGRVLQWSVTRGPKWVLLILLAFLVLSPLAYIVYGALHNRPPGSRDNDFSLEQFAGLFSSGTLLRTLGNTLALAVTVSIIAVTVGFLLVVVVTRIDLPLRRLWETLSAGPMFVSPLFVTVAVVALFGRGGYIGSMVNSAGLGNGPDFNSFAGVVIVLSFYFSSYTFLFLLGPVSAVSGGLEEAGAVLGAKPLRRIVVMLLGVLRPTLGAVAVMVFAMALEAFTVPAILVGIKFPTLATQIYYDLTYEPTNPNRAAAMALFLLALTACALYIFSRLTRRSKLRQAGFAVRGGGSRRLYRPRPVTRYALSVLVGSFSVLGFIIPLLTLIVASLQNYIHPVFDGFTFDHYADALRGSLNAAGNTVLLGVSAATITCILGFLVSYVVGRTEWRANKVLSAIATIPIAVPGMVFAIGMLWMYISIPIGLYGTLGLLLIGYVSHLLAQGVRVTGGSLSGVNRQFEEAAQISGAGFIRRAATIFAPMMKRGFASAWIILFVFVMNEVPMTILLYSPGNETLSVTLWNSLSIAGPGEAAVFAVVMGLASTVAMIVLRRFGGEVAAAAGAERPDKSVVLGKKSNRRNK